MATTTETGERLKALVDAEASAAETDDTTETEVPAAPDAEAPPAEAPEPSEPEPEPELAPEPEPEPPGNAPSMEAFEKALEKATKNNEKRLREVFGEGFSEFEPCDACGTLGFRHVAAIPLDPETEPCPACRGHGVRLTGAFREGQQARECTQCQGTGYRMRLPEPATETPTAPPRPMFDPYTGERLPENGQPAGGETVPGWAPGYVPQGQGLPVRAGGA